MPVIEQDQTFDTIEAMQSRVLETNQKVAETMADRFATAGKLASNYSSPVLERMPKVIADRFSALPPALPEIPGVVSPSAAVNTYFDLVERATKANRKFASELVNIWSPAAPAPAAQETPKPAAKKATPKKAAAKKATPKTVAPKTVAKVEAPTTNNDEIG